MAMLHIVNKSPFERNALSSCLRLAAEGSSVLMIEDGVIGAMNNSAFSEQVKGAMGGLKVYVLGPDVKARGISDAHLIEGIKSVDYSGFVDLVAEHDNNQSWL
ncbi:MAG: sulfurtransferase complex subunit TusB [Thiotrichales bacterium]